MWNPSNFPELAELAKSNLATLSIGNTRIVTGDALATPADAVSATAPLRSPAPCHRG